MSRRAVGKQAAVQRPIWRNPPDLSPGYWEASFQVQQRRVYEYAESRQFFTNSVVNMFNTYVMNDIKRIFNTNSNINKIAKNINCFVLVVPTSVIYEDKTSIKQIST